MLINTVIVFLSNSLSIFIVLGLLLSLKDKHQLSARPLFVGGVLGIFLMITLWLFIDDVIQSIDDTGLEWFYAITHIIVYTSVVLMLYGLRRTVDESKGTSSSHWVVDSFSFCCAMIFALMIMLQGTSVLIYFTGYWSQENVANALFIGIILGAGICISIGILWYFFCNFLTKNVYINSVEILLILFACGLLNKTSSLLLQIDILPSTMIVWDLNFLVKESSELGYFLSALLGYDARPTFLQVIIYFTVLFIALVIYQRAINPWRLFRFKRVTS
jgi:high-affinity iron transporter